MTSPLYQKRLALDGDSICQGAGHSGGYGKIIAERNNMSFENIGVGGGTVTAETYYDDGQKRHWITRSIERLDENADYVLLCGGVNDASLGVPLGRMTDGFCAPLDDTTFYGAFEAMLKKLITKFHGKKVGYIAVHQMTPLFRACNDPENSYYWAAKRCCEKWGVPFCDLNVSCPAFAFFKQEDGPLWELRRSYTYNGDGWHPNEQGYLKYYCDKIEAWMKTL